MPMFVYQCPMCGDQFIDLTPHAEEVWCEDCNRIMERVFSPFAVSYRGSGFYSTDNPPDESNNANTSH